MTILRARAKEMVVEFAIEADHVAIEAVLHDVWSGIRPASIDRLCRSFQGRLKERVGPLD
jgi:hypothetical protein